jgi:hypothetical protein
MSELETDVTDDATDVVDSNETDSSETADGLTVDDYIAEKTRREKAEKALVDLKKKNKELESKTSETAGDYLTRDDLALERFIDKNSELSEYQDDLKKYAKAIAKEK